MRLPRAAAALVLVAALAGCSDDDGGGGAQGAATTPPPAPTATTAAPTTSAPATTASPASTATPAAPEVGFVDGGYGGAGAAEAIDGVAACADADTCEAPVVLVERGRDATGRPGEYGVALELREDATAPVEGWFRAGLPGVAEAAVTVALTDLGFPLQSALILADESDAGRDAVGWAEPFLQGVGVAVTSAFPLGVDELPSLDGVEVVIALLDADVCTGAVADALAAAAAPVIAGPGCRDGGALGDGDFLVTDGPAGDDPGPAADAAARLVAGERPQGVPTAVNLLVPDGAGYTAIDELSVTLAG
jgi:hypothetical protein